MALYCALVALAGTALSLLSLIALHVLPTGVNPLRDPVSRYGTTRFRLVYRIGTIALGLAGIALALGLPRAAQNDATVATTGLVVFGLAQCLIGWFPDDSAPGERTVGGQRHLTLVVLFYGGVTVAAFGYSTVFPQAGLFASIAPAADVLAWAMVALDAVVLLTLIPRLRGFRGLAERVLHLPILAWTALVAVPLLSAPF